ncbi:alpha/beta hydrolase [Rhizobium skierniewicense]|uniref:alpha/beta fold hydrolase n=1 Tax=Rhizobium skierniewicense TaxID=984260 RepID=UPI001FAD48D6|nr:alpha/beta hydrolase [Rhizobium skierniewicense]MCI9868544.1 alpha/beta hydrolase [Rhizobium skierniewicense]
MLTKTHQPHLSQTPARYEARHLDENGADISYSVDGIGPALVLVHGTALNAHTNWAELVEPLSQVRTVIRPNYSGSGTTTDSGGELTVERLATQVVSAAKAANAIPFDLVGFSLGAAVAVHIAAHHPEKVRSLVLIGGLLASEDPRMQLQLRLWQALCVDNTAALAKIMVLTGFSQSFLASLNETALEGMVDTISTETDWSGMARQIALALVLDVRAEAVRVQAPTLSIGLSQDQIAPPHLAEALAKPIPGAAFAQVDSGHLGPLEKPAELELLITAFLQQQMPPAAAEQAT